MDNKPIGVFDSGLGGLTAMRKLMEVLPGEDLIYLGDTGRLPYGGRSRETIIRYARQDIAFLQKFNIKAIVAACGTVSTTALDEIKDDYDIPLFGVVEAAAKTAASSTKNKKVGLIGTQASIRSGTYDRLIKGIDQNIEIFGKACPLLVPLVEEGRINIGDRVTETVLREYLEPILEKGIDTLILGCTHYPLLTGIIREIVGKDVRLINPGEETAKFVEQSLREKGMLSEKEIGGTQQYFVSDRIDDFMRMASRFLEMDVRGDVGFVNVDNF